MRVKERENKNQEEQKKAKLLKDLDEEWKNERK